MHGVFLDADIFYSGMSGPTTYKNAICVFEHNPGAQYISTRSCFFGKRMLAWAPGTLRTHVFLLRAAHTKRTTDLPALRHYSAAFKFYGGVPGAQLVVRMVSTVYKCVAAHTTPNLRPHLCKAARPLPAHHCTRRTMNVLSRVACSPTPH